MPIPTLSAPEGEMACASVVEVAHLLFCLPLKMFQSAAERQPKVEAFAVLQVTAPFKYVRPVE